MKFTTVFNWLACLLLFCLFSNFSPAQEPLDLGDDTATAADAAATAISTEADEASTDGDPGSETATDTVESTTPDSPTTATATDAAGSSAVTTPTTTPAIDQASGETTGTDDQFDLAEPAPIDPPSDIMLDPASQSEMGIDSMQAFDGAEALDAGGSSSRVVDFQEEDLPQVLRLLARQAKINLYVSEQVAGSLTLRVQDKTPMETLRFIVRAKGLVMDEIEGDFFVKTQGEKASEPTESGSYTFSYAPAEDAARLLASQLNSGAPVQVDSRTNTVFYQEVVSNVDNIKQFLETIDLPTEQVLIEARLVEVNANPKQSYGINWAGVVGGSSTPQTLRYGGSPFPDAEDGTYEFEVGDNGQLELLDFARFGENSNVSINGLSSQLFDAVAGQFAILSVPQMSLTMRLLNEDSDAEFLAQPRIVTANNQEATISITRNQPVPQLNFNEQTATAVFGGFEDKEFGNTLRVRPSINKDDFITLNVVPEVSNKVGDATFVFAGATVASPIIDSRKLESNILIKSGNTLAIGGLLQDEQTKGSTKVPILGDIPVLGYLFQEKVNARVKRNLLVFVTPTVLEHGQGTGLEDQVGGLHDSGEEYADPNGWRNNAKGAIRLVPTTTAQRAGDYPKPGTPLQPQTVGYKTGSTGSQ